MSEADLNIVKTIMDLQERLLMAQFELKKAKEELNNSIGISELKNIFDIYEDSIFIKSKEELREVLTKEIK